ncbi:MAG: hypothetical protein FJZ00_07495 [Candidatus Sericytochromatia bacterium]|uniref:Uncharacterized protein n=1 Tax=Candidatus Tanganyikabacteria bacterium TaxID=2961651 RepID=A0A937X6B0_9BACT|nr:hypothetical protein [Candidatus Tanganyikabacteria bacterium]
MELLTRFFDFGGDRPVEQFKAAMSQRDPILYLFLEEDEPWHQFLLKYLMPVLDWRLSLFPEDDTPAFEIHGEQSIEVERESSGKLPEVALLNVFPMIPGTRDYDLFLKQYEKFQNMYPFVFYCRPKYSNFVQLASGDLKWFSEHIKLYFGAPSLRFETIAMDALRYSFKEIERQAFLLQTQAARALPPRNFRAGQETQQHLTARHLAYNTLAEQLAEEDILVERRLYKEDPAYTGGTAADSLELDRLFAQDKDPDPERLDAFEEFRVPDLLVEGEVWVEIEPLSTVAFGDQDPFAAWQRKLLAKLPWIASCKEFWAVIPNVIAAVFPEEVASVARGIQGAMDREGGRTRVRLFCSDYAAMRLHEVEIGASVVE